MYRDDEICHPGRDTLIPGNPGFISLAKLISDRPFLKHRSRSQTRLIQTMETPFAQDLPGIFLRLYFTSCSATSADRTEDLIRGHNEAF